MKKKTTQKQKKILAKTAGSEKERKIRRQMTEASAVFWVLFAALILLWKLPGRPLEGRAYVVAHRAGAWDAPENTLAALENAIVSGADMVEMDFQETQDGELVCFHDTSLKRTAGWNKNVWELTYEELQKADVGSYFSADYAGEQIPTLEDVLKMAKGKIHLMLELKSNGHEKNLAEKAVKLIEQYGMEEQCSIVSMSARILKKAKELNPDIPAIYISRVVEQRMLKQDYIDGFSVKVTFINEGDVRKTHLRGKSIYGWTANRKADVKKLLRCGVDGVITDNISMAENCMTDEETDEQRIISFRFLQE